METHLIEQGTDAWKQLRRGKVTASRVADIIAKTKTGYSTSRDKYMTQLLLERLTGTIAESYTNAAMEHGIEQEPFARAKYEGYASTLVEQVAFIDHPTIPMSGASPDGLVMDDGLVELKAPMSHTHLESILGGIDDQYMPQVQWQMAVTGRSYTDLCSYDPRFPEHLQLVVKRIPRDDDYIAKLEKEVIKFLAELDDKVNKVNKIEV
jgi:putative phage-type endonuclease